MSNLVNLLEEVVRRRTDTPVAGLEIRVWDDMVYSVNPGGDIAIDDPGLVRASAVALVMYLIEHHPDLLPPNHEDWLYRHLSGVHADFASAILRRGAPLANPDLNEPGKPAED